MFLLLLSGPAWAQAPLRLGVLPYAAPEHILERFAPLQRSLEAALGTRITVVSARDVESFLGEVVAGRYDLVYLTPHLGLYAMRVAGWRPLARGPTDILTAVVVRRNSPMRSLDELKGRTVALPDPLAAVSLVARAELTRIGLNPGETVSVIHTSSLANALGMLTLGLADAAATSTAWLNRISPLERERFRLLEVLPMSFTIVFMAGRDLPESNAEAARGALLEFMRGPAGAAFFKSTDHAKSAPLTEADLDKYAPLLSLLGDAFPQGARAR